MKNIHVIPTDKPSKLCLDSKDKLWFASNSGYTIADGKQNIYITNSEEIKEGDYYIDFTSDGLKIEHFKTKDDWVLVGICDSKKIILTTDSTLIADGVQAIDDNFLEWFVKNPSCERVEVETDYLLWKNSKKAKLSDCYKIIIPKEEPNQETLEEIAENKFGLVDPILGKSDYRMGYESGLIAGAKSDAAKNYWFKEFKQDKNKYSEEDMVAFLDWSKSTNKEKSEYELSCLLKGNHIDSQVLFNMWFNQFKKK
jgi:hypothetical protein